MQEILNLININENYIKMYEALDSKLKKIISMLNEDSANLSNGYNKLREGVICNGVTENFEKIKTYSSNYKKAMADFEKTSSNVAELKQKLETENTNLRNEYAQLASSI